MSIVNGFGGGSGVKINGVKREYAGYPIDGSIVPGDFINVADGDMPSNGWGNSNISIGPPSQSRAYSLGKPLMLKSGKTLFFYSNNVVPNHGLVAMLYSSTMDTIEKESATTIATIYYASHICAVEMAENQVLVHVCGKHASTSTDTGGWLILLTVNGSSLTINRTLQYGTFGASAGANGCGIAKVSDTRAIILYDSSSAIVRSITISGTTLTMGSPIDLGLCAYVSGIFMVNEYTAILYYDYYSGGSFYGRVSLGVFNAAYTTFSIRKSVDTGTYYSELDIERFSPKLYCISEDAGNGNIAFWKIIVDDSLTSFTMDKFATITSSALYAAGRMQYSPYTDAVYIALRQSITWYSFKLRLTEDGKDITIAAMTDRSFTTGYTGSTGQMYNNVNDGPAAQVMCTKYMLTVIYNGYSGSVYPLYGMPLISIAKVIKKTESPYRPNAIVTSINNDVVKCIAPY